MCQAQQQPKHPPPVSWSWWCHLPRALSPFRCFCCLWMVVTWRAVRLLLTTPELLLPSLENDRYSVKLAELCLYVMWGSTRGAYSYYCYCRVVHLTIFKFHSPAAIVSLHYYGLLTRLLASSTCPTRNLCLEFNSSPSVSAKVPVRCCPP